MTEARNSQSARQTKTAASGRSRAKTARSSSNSEVKTRRIPDWPALFEPSDAKRKKQEGGLSFTKSQVTTHFLSNEAEQRFAKRLRVLKSHPLRHLLRSTFEDIKNWTAAKHRAQRGLLVDAQGRAVTYSYLAAQLDQMPVADLKKAMPILEQIGLIEWGMFDGSPDGTGQSRMQPDAAGSKRLALNKDNDKAKRKSKSKNKQKARSDETTVAAHKDNADNGKNDPQNKADDQVPCQPASPESLPSEPHLSDDGGRGRTIPFTRPPDSAEISRHGLTYGRRVYLALGYHWDVDSPEAYREIASFGSKHDQVCSRLSGIDPPSLDAILNRLLREASTIAKRRGNRNKAAVWHTVADRIVAKHSGATGQGRSPPASEKAG